MNKIAGIAGIVAAVLVTACSQGSTPADESLSRDLEMAASEGITLAPSPASLDLASAEISPRLVTAPAPSGARHHENSPVQETALTAVSIEPADVVAITSAPAPVEAPSGELATVDVPAPVHRPAPIPAEMPSPGSSNGEGGGVGTAIGTVIGVIIRGGVAGDDHCDPRGHRGGIRIGGRGGVSIPIGGGSGGAFINRRLPASGSFARPR